MTGLPRLPGLGIDRQALGTCHPTFKAEGYGKTRLLKEFVARFNQYFSDDGIAIYIDATGVLI